MNIPIAIAGVIAVLAMITVIVSYNGIVDRANAAKRAWASVVTYERQKNEVIPQLESVVSQSKDFETALQSKIAQLRTSVRTLSNDNIDPAALEKLSLPART